MRESPMGMSQVGLYQACPRKWAMKYLLGWREKSEEIAEPLVYGQAIHEGKEEFYKTGNAEQAREKSLTYLQEQEKLPDEIFHKLTEKANACWDVWPKAFGNDDLKKFDIIGIEKEGWLELPNGINLSVRLDLLVREKSTGNIYIIDTKTTGAAPSRMLLDYYYKAQPRIYCAWLMKEMPAFRAHFRGWITDVLSQRFLKAGLKTECERSSAVFYSAEQINDAMISMAILTDEIAEKTDMVINKNLPINYAFTCNYNNCRAYYRNCPYFNECGKEFHFGDNPGSNFSLDPWVKDRTVIKEYIS